VIVKMNPGRTEEQKRRLAEQIVQNVMTILNAREEAVSVAIEEVSRDDWTEKVYKPDILANWDKLYKEPGYKPAD
jgi:4-oxalocrotonate tautomerase